jgi:hypothetical protein
MNGGAAADGVRPAAPTPPAGSAESTDYCRMGGGALPCPAGGDAHAACAQCDDAEQSPAAVLVENPRLLGTGSRLVGDIFVGPFLGAGMSARVFELVTQDGKPTGKVVKIAHTDLGHRAVNSIWIGMEVGGKGGWARCTASRSISAFSAATPTLRHAAALRWTVPQMTCPVPTTRLT